MRKKTMIRTALLTVLIFGFVPIGLTAYADRPPESVESLTRMSSDVVKGTVQRVYEKVVLLQNVWEVHYCIAEIKVDTVKHGDGIAVGDVVYAKYYFKNWVGEGSLPPSWGGQSGIPEGQVGTVYLRGDATKGYKVTEPNGFSQDSSKSKLRQGRKGTAVQGGESVK